MNTQMNAAMNAQMNAGLNASARQRTRPMRIGPVALDGSTRRPRWVMITSPSASRRRAAARAGSINSRQSSPPTRRAASLGQIVAPVARASSNSMIAAASSISRAAAVRERPRRRQPSEQYFTESKSRAHLRRHSIRRPQTVQVLSGSSAPDRARRCRGSAIVFQHSLRQCSVSTWVAVGGRRCSGSDLQYGSRRPIERW